MKTNSSVPNPPGISASAEGHEIGHEQRLPGQYLPGQRRAIAIAIGPLYVRALGVLQL
jgi:hypothetical protein